MPQENPSAIIPEFDNLPVEVKERVERRILAGFDAEMQRRYIEAIEKQSGSITVLCQALAPLAPVLKDLADEYWKERNQ